MKRQIFFAVLVMALCSVSIWAQTNATIITLQSNIRESASIDSEVLATVKKGAKVKVLSTEHVYGWYYISYGKIKGWIHGNNIKIAGIKAVTKTSKAKDEWKYYTSSSEGNFYYNPGKMSRKGSIVRVWTKRVSKTTYETLSMIQYEVQCSTEQIRSIAGALYNTNGSVYRSWDNQKARFESIIPETVSEALFEKLCQ